MRILLRNTLNNRANTIEVYITDLTICLPHCKRVY